MTAEEQLTRIVQLVGELTAVERAGGPAPSLGELAARFDVTPDQISADLATLTLLGEHADAEWLLSLSVWQQGDRVGVTSAGPFQRPLVFSPDERVAVQAALALDPDGTGLAARFAALWSRRTPAAGGTEPPIEDPAQVVRRSAAAREKVALWYAGEGETAASEWTIEPHQVVDYRGRHYAVSWSELTADWRHFRLDRIIAARATGRFAPRPDFQPVDRPEDLFRVDPKLVDRVEVRFSPKVARWVKERYPTWRLEADGSVVVTLPVSSEAWLVRRVLEYGAEAEVVGPERYRAAVRRAVA